MAQFLPEQPIPEVIVPVPLHRRRLAQRGYNQALELARWIGRGRGIPVAVRVCRRRRATAEQSGLSAGERRRNVSDAFIIDKSFSARHVAIVDDVMTTGSTLNELAGALRRHGVDYVTAWVCARAHVPG